MAGAFVRARRAADGPREDGPVRGRHPPDERAWRARDGARPPRGAHHAGRRQDSPRDRARGADRDGRVPRPALLREDAARGGVHRADALRGRGRHGPHVEVRPAGLRARRDRRGAPRDGRHVPPVHRLVQAEPRLQDTRRHGDAGPRGRGGARPGVRERRLRVRRPGCDQQRLARPHRAADGHGRLARLLRRPHDGGRPEPGRPRGRDGGRAQPAGRGRPDGGDLRGPARDRVRGHGGHHADEEVLAPVGTRHRRDRPEWHGRAWAC